MLTHFITFFLDFTWIKSTVELEHRYIVQLSRDWSYANEEELSGCDGQRIVLFFFWRHRLHLLALSWQPRRGPYHVMQFGRETKANIVTSPRKFKKSFTRFYRPLLTCCQLVCGRMLPCYYNLIWLEVCHHITQMFEIEFSQLSQWNWIRRFETFLGSKSCDCKYDQLIMQIQVCEWPSSCSL